MTRDEITERLMDILLETFELEEGEISAESNLYEDLGLDSIDAVDLFVQIRDITNRRPDPAEAREVRTFAELVELVQRELERAAAGAPEPGDPEGLASGDDD
jgi:acyl carrier protein